MLCESCARLSLSQEMTRVFRHADAGLALGEREGNRQRERKMKGKNYFEKPRLCDVDIFLISD